MKPDPLGHFQAPALPPRRTKWEGGGKDPTGLSTSASGGLRLFFSPAAPFPPPSLSLSPSRWLLGQNRRSRDVPGWIGIGRMIRARAGAGVCWLDAGGKTGWCYPRGCIWRRHWGWDVDPASSGAALAMQRACILHGSFKYISSASNSMCCKSRRMVELAMTEMCIIIERTSTEFPRSRGTCSVSGPCQARDFGILSLRFRMRMAIGDWPMCRCRCCNTEASRLGGRKGEGVNVDRVSCPVC